MNIKILKSCAGIKFSFFAGDVVDVENIIAKDLIQAGFAEEVKLSGKGDNSARKRAGRS